MISTLLQRALSASLYVARQLVLALSPQPALPLVIVKCQATEEREAGKMHYIGMAIQLTLPVTAASLADPNGALSLRAAWTRAYKLILYHEVFNQIYADRLKESRVSSRMSKEEERLAVRFWKTHLSSIEYASTGELEQLLSHIFESQFEPLLHSPPVSSYAPGSLNKLLLRPEIESLPFIGLESSMRWLNADQLEAYLGHSPFAAANCLSKLYADAKSAKLGLPYVVQILEEESYLRTFCASEEFGIRDERLLIATGPRSKPRVSAVLEICPLLTATFIAFTVRCLQEYVDGSDVLRQAWEEEEEGSSSSSDTSRNWQDYAQARSFALQLLCRFISQAAPMLIVCTAHQLIIIERVQQSSSSQVKLKLYTTILAQRGPEPSVEPADEAARELLSEWTTSMQHNFIMQMTLLSIRADHLVHSYSPMNAYVRAAPLAQAQAQAQAKQTHQLSNTHTLLFHTEHFAYGGIAYASHACIVPSTTEEVSRCDSLLLTPLAAASSPCANPQHRKAVVKTPRTHRLDEEDVEPDSVKLAAWLEEEAQKYEALETLQSVLPRFFGRWKVGEKVLYAYEDVGSALSDVKARKKLNLSFEEAAFVKEQFSAMLQQLHQAGYSHGDACMRNMCVRRTAAAADGTAQLECRLIDLSEASELRSLSEERRSSRISDDFFELERANFEQRVYEA